jgi:hypothetical protein
LGAAVGHHDEQAIKLTLEQGFQLRDQQAVVQGWRLPERLEGLDAERQELLPAAAMPLLALQLKEASGVVVLVAHDDPPAEPQPHYARHR